MGAKAVFWCRTPQRLDKSGQTESMMASEVMLALKHINRSLLWSWLRNITATVGKISAMSRPDLETQTPTGACPPKVCCYVHISPIRSPLERPALLPSSSHLSLLTPQPPSPSCITTLIKMRSPLIAAAAMLATALAVKSPVPVSFGYKKSLKFTLDEVLRPFSRPLPSLLPTHH